MLVEVVEIARGLFAAALFVTKAGLFGPELAFKRCAGGNTPQAALIRLGVSPRVTVVFTQGGVLWPVR